MEGVPNEQVSGTKYQYPDPRNNPVTGIEATSEEIFPAAIAAPSAQNLALTTQSAFPTLTISLQNQNLKRDASCMYLLFIRAIIK